MYQFGILPSTNTVVALGSLLMSYFQEDSTKRLKWVGKPINTYFNTNSTGTLSFAMHPTLPRTYFALDGKFVEQNTITQQTAQFLKEPFPYWSHASVVLGDNIFALIGSSLARIRRNVITDVRLQQMNADYLHSRIYPNPAGDFASLQFSLQEPSRVSFEVVDLLGKVIMAYPQENQSVGERNILLNLESIATGVYSVRLRAVSKGKTHMEIKRMIVSR